MQYRYMCSKCNMRTCTKREGHMTMISCSGARSAYHITSYNIIQHKHNIIKHHIRFLTADRSSTPT